MKNTQCKKVIFLKKPKSRYRINVESERRILIAHGFLVQIESLGSLKDILGLYNILDGSFLHAHDISCMVIGWFLSILKRTFFVKDYHQILLSSSSDTSYVNKINFYEQPETWQDNLSERDKNRFEKIIELVPEGVKSILDIGCGRGELALRLRQKLNYPVRIVEVDRSRTTLDRFSHDAIKVLADINALSFKDKAFDLVICSEVFEHLDSREMKGAIAAIKKISSRYIIIGVPNDENLLLSGCRCYNCKKKFHINYHKRSFRLSKIKKMFLPELSFKRYIYGGAERIYYNNILLYIKQNIAGVWVRKINTLCPFCGVSQKFQGIKERNAISWYCDNWNKRLRQRVRSRQSHIIALYAKE